MLVRRQKIAKFILLNSIFLTTVSNADPIYKATLPDGRIIYTDNVDSAYKQVADKSQITVLDNLENQTPTPHPILPPVVASVNVPIPSNTASVTTSSPTTLDELVSMNISSTEASQSGTYQLSIQSPQPETAYHRPAQQIEVQLSITPNLKEGDSIVYTIDGKEIGRSHNTAFSFPSTDIDPDKHTLSIAVINNLGKAIASTSADFYVILTNPLVKKQKEIIAKRATYEALPWYKKLSYI